MQADWATLTSAGGHRRRRRVTAAPPLTRVGGGGVELDAVILQGLQALGQQREAVAGHGGGVGAVGRAVRGDRPLLGPATDAKGAGSGVGMLRGRCYERAAAVVHTQPQRSASPLAAE